MRENRELRRRKAFLVAEGEILRMGVRAETLAVQRVFARIKLLAGAGVAGYQLLRSLGGGIRKNRDG